MIPFPTDSGSKIRIYEFTKRLSNAHSVSLIGLHPQPYLDKNTIDKLGFMKTIVPVAHSTSKLKAIAKWVFSQLPYRYVKMKNSNFRKAVELELKTNSYDVVILHCLDSVQNLPSEKNKKVTYVLDQHNDDIIWYKSFSNSKSFVKRVFSYENIRRQRIRNQKDYKQIDLCLCVSLADLYNTRKQVNNSSVLFEHIPNGADFSNFQRTNYTYKKNLIFCGSLDVEMNIDAITFFIRDIFPLVIKELPETILTVVGRNPSKKVRDACQHRNIHLYSNVESVVPFYNDAQVIVLPFRHGGGSKLKVMEAIAMEVDIVSTEAGVVGIPPEVVDYLSISNDTLAFASKTIEKLKIDFSNPIERHRLASLKSRCVNEYSWAAQHRRIEVLLNQICTSKN